MKFTHNDYKCWYFLPSNEGNGKYERRRIVANQRYQINLDFEYHTSWVNIYTDDTEFESFDLGLDFSHPNHITKNRCMNRLFLNFVIKGKGKFNGEPFSAGQFYYTLPNETHTIEADADEPYVSAWLSVTGTYTEHIINEIGKKSSEKIMSLERRKEILEITKTFLYSVSIGETSVPYLKSLINIYLTYITSDKDAEYPEVFATEKIAQLVHKAKSYVKNNLKTASVADMAAAQHYNQKHFTRVFTEAMGLTPVQYIIDCKMEWAKHALEHSGLSITEIIEAVGYDHRNGFSIAFKKKYGCTPSEFRKSTKK